MAHPWARPDDCKTEVQKAEWRQRTYALVLQELKDNPAIQAELKSYNAASAKRAIEFYANKKLHWLEMGEFFVKENKKKSVQWLATAFACLRVIQAKKLLNLECRWRAEEIKLPGVEICFDFNLLRQDVFSVPFVPPITEEEMNLYLRYLHESTEKEMAHEDDYNSLMCHRKSDWFNKKPGGYNSYPLFYSLYDEHFGTGHLMQLPDTRREKEDYYTHLLGESTKEEREREIAAAKAADDPRPRAKYYKEEFKLDFITNCETPEMLEYYKAFRYWEKRHSKNYFVDRVWYKLRDVREHIPVQNNVSWRQELFNAYHRYSRAKTAEVLPAAFQLYLDNLGHPEKYTGYKKETYDRDDMRERLAENVLKGRALAGEPRDFNF